MKEKASLIGRSIYCTKGKSLDLTDPIISAYIQCDEIISLTEGINIANKNEPIVIEANYIEGSSGNGGVIKSEPSSNYVLRNAKIKCTDTTIDSVCILLPDGDVNDQSIEIENLILVTGNTTDGDTIRRIKDNEITIKNLNLFVNKAIDDDVIILEIGVGFDDPVVKYNYKYIVDGSIS